MGAPVLDSGTRTKTTAPTTSKPVYPGGYDPTKKAPTGVATGDMYSGGNLQPGESQMYSDWTNLLTNINPYGGIPSGGSGGGGGGSSTPPPDYSQFGAWAAQARPGMYGFTPLEQNYLSWDPSMFDKANQGITSGIADARKRGTTAFDLAAQQYQNYRDPYASGPKAYSPGVDPALMASMQAWGGAGSGEAMRQQDYANTADAAMGSIYDLLGSVGRQYNADNLAAVGGDRMQFNQGVDMAGNELRLGSDMARARAYGDWRNRDNDARNATAMANWGRKNQVGDTNVSTTNQWNQGILDAILEMIGSGGTGIPAAGNDLSRLITLPQYRSA